MASESMDRNGSRLIRDLCARPLNGSIIPVRDLVEAGTEQLNAVMSFPIIWSNPLLLHGGMN